jgi:hypothetical protein
MPYSIRKLPNKNLYRVRQKNTGEVLSKATTLNKAKAQVRLLMMIHRMKMTHSSR